MTIIPEPIARLLASLALSTCGACIASTASAQTSNVADASTASVTSPLPADMMRGAGKWLDKSAFDNQPNTSAAPAATAPAPLYFKPAEPGWISALDAASYFASGFAPTRARAPSRPVNNYNAPQAPDNTNGPGR